MRGLPLPQKDESRNKQGIEAMFRPRFIWKLPHSPSMFRQ